MAKMRAAIRKVAQVTPPPSPKHGDSEIKSEWSSRLRNHSTPIASKSFKGKRAKLSRAKKRNPVFNNEDSNGSRTSTPSPICENTRPRRNGDNQSHCWPRRSARLVGIPAEVEDDPMNKSNGSLKSEEEPESPRKRRASELNGGQDGQDEQCKNCNKRKTKVRGIDALLKESEHFMHYPTRRTNGCHVERQTCNSHDTRPPHETSPSPEPTPVLPASMDQVQFSFEMVPAGTSWYQTFLRDEGANLETEEPHTSPAPFLLPYEMTLEAILKGNQPVDPTKKKKGRPPKKKPVNQNFRPIISTRLQMQSAAKLEAQTKTSKTKESEADKDDRKRRHDRKRWSMPRKSPRCHASTMAILCSKIPELKPVAEEPEITEAAEVTEPCSSESQEVKEEQQGDLIKAIQDMLINDLDEEVKQPPVRKRGRPPKKHRIVGKPKEKESSLAEFLATPLERIEDMIDERLLKEPQVDALPVDEDDPMYPIDWMKAPSPELPETFHDADSHSGSRSSSVYETASEIESTSTGTSESNTRKVWKNRRKRRNMTGWPRSKKRKPTPLSIELDDELMSDDGPPSLSPIREEPSGTDECGSEEDPPPALQPSPGRYVGKPFQFQRKTLRFVGKRILRPAAQRHAPQRLEYWPCFTVTSSSPPRPRPVPRKRRCK